MTTLDPIPIVMTDPVQVRPGQVWVPKRGSHIHASRRVLAVDRASVWTGPGGRTTVAATPRSTPPGAS